MAFIVAVKYVLNTEERMGSVFVCFIVVCRDWSLFTGRGGQVKFYPSKKRGQKSFSHAEGGHKKF